MRKKVKMVEVNETTKTNRRLRISRKV